MNTPLEQWEAPEYIQKEHSVDWYWGIGLTCLALVGISILMDNVLFGIFIVIATVTVFYFSRREPHIISFALYADKLTINDRSYPFRTFVSFWIREPLLENNPTGAVLALREQRMTAPIMTIPIPDDIDLDALHELLSEYMDEEEHPEHLSEKIMDRLGF